MDNSTEKNHFRISLACSFFSYVAVFFVAQALLRLPQLEAFARPIVLVIPVIIMLPFLNGKEKCHPKWIIVNIPVHFVLHLVFGLAYRFTWVGPNIAYEHGNIESLNAMMITLMITIVQLLVLIVIRFFTRKPVPDEEEVLPL